MLEKLESIPDLLRRLKRLEADCDRLSELAMREAQAGGKLEPEAYKRASTWEAASMTLASAATMIQDIASR